MNHGKGYYATPYDSTQGVPDLVFIIFWIILLVFAVRVMWEFRDKLFKRK